MKFQPRNVTYVFSKLSSYRKKKSLKVWSGIYISVETLNT